MCKRSPCLLLKNNVKDDYRLLRKFCFPDANTVSDLSIFSGNNMKLEVVQPSSSMKQQHEDRKHTLTGGEWKTRGMWKINGTVEPEFPP